MNPKQPNNNKPRPKQGGGNRNGSNGPSTSSGQANGRGASRGAAIRAQRRAQDDANTKLNQYVDLPSADEKPRANFIDDSPRLKIIGLGGMDGGGSKNMILVEYHK